MTFKQNIRAMSKAAGGAAGALLEAAERLNEAPPGDGRAAAVGGDGDLLDALLEYTVRLDTLTHAVDALTGAVLARKTLEGKE